MPDDGRGRRPAEPNFYELLGIRIDASERDIRCGLRDRQREWHYQENSSNFDREVAARRNLRLVPKIEKTLLDREARRRYDERLLRQLSRARSPQREQQEQPGMRERPRQRERPALHRPARTPVGFFSRQQERLRQEERPRQQEGARQQERARQERARQEERAREELARRHARVGGVVLLVFLSLLGSLLLQEADGPSSQNRLPVGLREPGATERRGTRPPKRDERPSWVVEPRSSAAERAERELNLSPEQRRQIQAGLAADGVEIEIDGIFGPQTRTAVRRWQAANDFRVTGYLDAQTMAVLIEVAESRTNMVNRIPGAPPETGTGPAPDVTLQGPGSTSTERSRPEISPLWAPESVLGSPDSTPADTATEQRGDSTPPAKVYHVAPVYPRLAHQARVEGKVTLEVTVDSTGAVADVQVVKSVALLDDAAIAAVRQWKYTPARESGIAVPKRIRVTVNFER